MKSPAALLALGGIGAYQRFVSPYKGFHCAHHACTGGMTCSNYGRFALREYGFFAALPRIRERLHDCSEYATDPRKGKIHEDDPGPLRLQPCDGKSAHEGCIAADLGCTACLFLFPF